MDLTRSQEGPSTHLASTNSPLDRQQPDASRPAVDSTSSIPSISHQNRSPDEGIESNQVVIYKEGVVRFIGSGATLREVPFRKEDVNSQAKEYANQGKKLFLEQGPYFTWQDCFDILIRTGKSVVIIATVVEPRAGKRRRNEDLPERLQPTTKEAFDFNMIEEEEL